MVTMGMDITGITGITDITDIMDITGIADIMVTDTGIMDTMGIMVTVMDITDIMVMDTTDITMDERPVLLKESSILPVPAVKDSLFYTKQHKIRINLYLLYLWLLF